MRNEFLRACLGVAVSALFLTMGSAWAAEDESASECYLGVAGAYTLPQGGSRLPSLGGAALRGGWYVSDFVALEGEVAWQEDAAGLCAQGLFHWQGATWYGELFGYSQFDPFFTLGARGWLGRREGQVGPKVGVGAFYHMTDNWSLRADADALLGLDASVEMAYTLTMGVQYSF